jgi:diketogulonate reductase-like aldo/keto reductase
LAEVNENLRGKILDVLEKHSLQEFRWFDISALLERESFHPRWIDRIMRRKSFTIPVHYSPMEIDRILEELVKEGKARHGDLCQFTPSSHQHLKMITLRKLAKITPRVNKVKLFTLIQNASKVREFDKILIYG